MEAKREVYLNRLIQKKNNPYIKIITGVRRCGKSFLLKTLYSAYLYSQGVNKDQIIIIELDDDKFEDLRDRKALREFVENKAYDENKQYYIIIDEVQMVEDFEGTIISLNNHTNYDVYITGSNSKFLSKDIITEFAGRGDEIHMYPLSFNEFMSIYKRDKYIGLSEYMIYGGIPLVVLKENKEDKISTLNNLFTEIYIKDICKRNNIRNVTDLEDLLNILSSNIGSLTNPEKLKNTFRSVKKSHITSNTIKKYIDCFEDSFLIESTSRYDIKGKCYKDTPKKYYFSDLGLRNFRINFRLIEETHLMENIIYNELKMRGYNVDVGVVTIPIKNKLGVVERKYLEVDFICNIGPIKYYIQSAYSLSDEIKRNQEIRPFLKIDDSFKKIIITKDIVSPFYDDNGILTINIYDFLLNKDILKY